MGNSAEDRSWLRRWWFLLLCVGLGLPLVLGYTAFRLVLRHRVHERIQAIRDAGYPATLEELDEWYEQRPSGQNAADIYSEAFGRLVKPAGEEVGNLPWVGEAMPPRPGATLPPEMAAAVREHLEANREALQLLHEGASVERCRYPIHMADGVKCAMPHLTSIREGTDLLSLAAWEYAVAGEPAAAAKALKSSFVLANSLGSEPFLISQNVRYKANAIAVSALQHVIDRTVLPAEALGTLKEALQRVSHPGVELDRVLNAEKLFVLDAAHSDYLALVRALSEWQILAYRASGVLDQDALYCLQVVDKVIDACDKPFPQRLQGSRDVMSEAERRVSRRPWFHPLATVALPSFEHIFVDKAAHLARLRSARTGLAVERFRLGEGGLPGNLSELVPGHLDELPTDPFDGKPLRYKRLDPGYVVYSIGRDGDDDGGEERDRRDDGDIAFRITR